MLIGENENLSNKMWKGSVFLYDSKLLLKLPSTVSFCTTHLPGLPAGSQQILSRISILKAALDACARL